MVSGGLHFNIMCRDKIGWLLTKRIKSNTRISAGFLLKVDAWTGQQGEEKNVWIENGHVAKAFVLAYSL